MRTFIVGAQGDKVALIGPLPRETVTPQEAMEIAAQIVVMAEAVALMHQPEAERPKFGKVLRAVEAEMG